MLRTRFSKMLDALPPVRMYRSASRASPLAVAFATCYAKGSASDVIAQLQLEKREKIDWRRNVAFATFSGAYAGVAQHYIYNVGFSRVFGAGTDLATAARKVAADSLIHVPFFCLPIYYPFETVMLGQGSVADGWRRYRADAYDVLTTYWTIWPPVHALNFTLMPTEMRISVVACMSFVWLIYLSNKSHRVRES
jgi:protein Mpv17